MAVANPFQPGKAVDYSQEINVIPNQWGVINQLGIFTDKPGTQKTVMVSRTHETEAIIEPRNWDERNNTIVGGKRDVSTFLIPHYPVDDMITANDLDGNLSWGDLLAGGNNLLTLDSVRAEKMARIRKRHALTLEWARAQVIKDCTVVGPDGVVLHNYYTEFGGSRHTEYMDLSNATVDPLAKVESVYARIQDNISNGDVVTDVVALCSPAFFNALVGNQFVVESYQAFAQAQSAAVLNGRLTANQRGLDARFRTFVYGNITFIEVRGTIAGNDYVDSGEAYVLPMGTDTFNTYYAPANRVDTVNQMAQQSYYFEFLDEKRSMIEIMSESNFLNAVLRPQVIVTMDMADS